MQCLAKVVYHEARGEPQEGQIAVANVVMNRVESGQFPASVCEVASQENQFSGFSRRKDFGGFIGEAWEASAKAAELVLTDKVKDNTGGALFYLNPDKVSKKTLTAWRREYTVIKQIHNHKFFGEK